MQKSNNKEVEKLRDQGRWKEAWHLAVKWRLTKIPLFIASLILIGLLFVATSFYFYYKIIFASGWIGLEVFKLRQKSADKEVKKLRNQGRWREAWDLAVKWRLTKNTSIYRVSNTNRLTFFVATNFSFYYKNYFCFWLNWSRGVRTKAKICR